MRRSSAHTAPPFFPLHQHHPSSNSSSKSPRHRRESCKLPRTMYTQAQGHTNHGLQKKKRKVWPLALPQKNTADWSKKVECDQLTLLPIPPLSRPQPHVQGNPPSLLPPPPPSCERAQVEVSGWCIWHREPPHLRPTGRCSTARKQAPSHAYPASSWTPLSQSQSFCSIHRHTFIFSLEQLPTGMWDMQALSWYLRQVKPLFEFGSRHKEGI